MWLAASIGIGLVGALLLNWQFSSDISGIVLGALGGLVSGTLLSEVIASTIGWSWLTCIGLSGVFGWVTWISGLGWLTVLGVAIMGAVIGYFVGLFSQQRGWLLAVGASSAILGGWLGREAVRFIGIEWLGSAIVGTGIGVITWLVFRFWQSTTSSKPPAFP